MPTYKNGEQIKVVASDDFIAKNRVAQDEFIVDTEISKMKLNLSSKEYREMFGQWERLKQESSQRLQRIEQLSLSHQRQQYQKNSQRRQNPVSVVVEPNSSRNNNTNKTESSNVLKHLKLMKRITGT